jgi:hypothetical protein
MDALIITGGTGFIGAHVRLPGRSAGEEPAA